MKKEVVVRVPAIGRAPSEGEDRPGGKDEGGEDQCDHAAAFALDFDDHGSTASSVSICSSVRSARMACRQPVERRMWIASGREGSRLPPRIMLAYD